MRSLRKPALAALLALAACSPGGSPERAAKSGPAASAPTLDPPAAPASVGPALAPASADTGSDLLLTWVEPSGSFATPVYQMRLARFTGAPGGHWTSPVTVAEGKDLVANWADFPGSVAGPGGEILAHWSVKQGETYAAHLARSADGGATWTTAGLLQSDPTAGEHGFVSYAVDGGGFRAFWLEGSEGGIMRLLSTRIAAGASPGPGPVEVLDERVCDCCQTGAVATPAGPVVVYRDRSEREIRDISALRRTASGWAPPVGVHADGWELSGCPVNGPAVAAAGNRLAVAWFTGAPPGPRVEVAFSADGGASFGAPVVVDGGRPVGRVDVRFDSSGSAVVSWVAPAAEGDRSAIWLRRVQPAGRAGAPLEVPGTRTVRASGFPRLGLAGDRLLLVWADDGTPSRLRAALQPIKF
jgi:hypothetical protein